jgi:hypothetical protein
MDDDTTTQMYISDELGALPKKDGGVLPEDMGKLTITDFESKEDYNRYLRILHQGTRESLEENLPSQEDIKRFIPEDVLEERASGGRIGYKEGTKKIKSWPKGLQNLKYLMSELIAGKGTDWRTGSEWYDKLSDEKIRDIIGGKTGKIYARDKGYLPKVLYDEPEEGRGYYLKAQGGRIGFNAGGSHKAWLTSKGYKDMMKGMSSAEITQLYDSVKGTWSKADGGRIGKYGGGIGAAMPRIPTGMPRVNAGGITELDYRSSGGFVPVGVKEKADDVPAMLSKNEFVMTADAVKAAGGGSVEKGAQKMYDTMKRLEGRIA